MPIQIYNSLTRKKEILEPRTPGHLDMFVCGPTVYDRAHLGNARTFTLFDVIAKWLRYRNYDVTYIQNITDIDDKIIKRASEQNSNPLDYARKFDELFRSDMLALGNTAVTEFKRATDYIPQVITQVKTLIEKKNVYLIDGDGWYFDLTTFSDYGKLSGRTGLAADDAVSRIDDSEKKRNTGDFCVWKLSKPGEPLWQDQQLGDGRPGWHIEDTAITESIFGPQYDIHGGGIDLKFPHHEAEIAQQEAASGLVPFVRYWMHAGFLQVNAERMGKSAGNFSVLHDLLAQYDPAVIRFYLLSNHYRAPLDFNEQSLNAAQAAVNRIGQLVYAKTETILTSDSEMTAIAEAMDDDFNTAKAFDVLFQFIRRSNALNAKPNQQFFDALSSLFGIIPPQTAPLSDAIQKIVDERQTARDEKDFATSDRLRDEIAQLGYTIDDTPYGPLIKKR